MSDYWTKQDDPMQDDIMTWIAWNRDNFCAITPGTTGTGINELVSPSISLPSFILPIGAAGLLLFFLSRA